MKKALFLQLALLIGLLPLFIRADDLAGPTISWANPGNNSCRPIDHSQPNLDINVGAEDPSGVKQGVLWMKEGHHAWTSDRSSWMRIWGYTYAHDGSAPTTVSETITIRMEGRTETEYTFLIEFADMARHNTSTVLRYVSIDHDPPTVAITSPSDGHVVCRDMSLKVKVDASDPASGCGVGSVQLYLQGATAATPFAVDTAPPYEFTVPKANLAVATLRLTVKVIDRSGRSSQAEITVKPTRICIIRATR